MAKLVPIKVLSIYPLKSEKKGPLPKNMAYLTPDAARALEAAAREFEQMGCCFRLSDAYRSTAMQAKAHEDWRTGRKKAYSPPAGGSFHEAGRAIDIDLAALIHKPSVPKGFRQIGEPEVRAVLARHGWTPISSMGHPNMVDVSESWHFEFRGPFQAVYDKEVRRGNKAGAYKAAARAAIKDLSQPDKPVEASPAPAPPEVLDHHPAPVEPPVRIAIHDDPDPEPLAPEPDAPVAPEPPAQPAAVETAAVIQTENIKEVKIERPVTPVPGGGVDDVPILVPEPSSPQENVPQQVSKALKGWHAAVGAWLSGGIAGIVALFKSIPPVVFWILGLSIGALIIYCVARMILTDRRERRDKDLADKERQRQHELALAQFQAITDPSKINALFVRPGGAGAPPPPPSPPADRDPWSSGHKGV